MLAVLAAIVFVIGLILKLAGSSLGRMDPVAWGLLGLALLALHEAFNIPFRRP